jgi:hypothetical protein
MRLRLLKLSCLVLVLALAAGLLLFDFAGDDLQSAFIETSSVTPAALPDNSASADLPAAAVARTSAPAVTGVPTMDTASLDPAPAAVSAPGDAQASAAELGPVQATDMPVQAAAAPSASPAPDQAAADEQAAPAAPAQTQPVQTPDPTRASDQRPAPVASVEGHILAPPAPAPAEAAPPPVAAAEPAPAASNGKSSVTKSASGGFSVRAAIPAPAKKQPSAPAAEAAAETANPAGAMAEGRSAFAAAIDAPAAPPPAATPPQAAAAPASPPASSAQPRAAKKPAAAPEQSADDEAAYQIASNAQPPAPSAKLVAQAAPPSKAPLVSSETRDPRASSSPLFGSQVALGPEMLVEFPSLQSTASGSLAGTGSVTNSSARIIPGIVGSWTSAPLDGLPLGLSVGGSLFIGAPASGDSVASAGTSGGYTLKLGQTNMWPVIMPRFFMGVPVTDSTRASLGTGVWINNIKETATLANASSTQSDEHSGVMVRPFLNAAIMQRAPLFGFLSPDAQKLKLSGGYIFGDSSFQAAFCASGQTCVKTSDQGSWFLGLSYEFGFPVGGTAPH